MHKVVPRHGTRTITDITRNTWFTGLAKTGFYLLECPRVFNTLRYKQDPLRPHPLSVLTHIIGRNINSMLVNFLRQEDVFYQSIDVAYV